MTKTESFEMSCVRARGLLDGKFACEGQSQASQVAWEKNTLVTGCSIKLQKRNFLRCDSGPIACSETFGYIFLLVLLLFISRQIRNDGQ